MNKVIFLLIVFSSTFANGQVQLVKDIIPGTTTAIPSGSDFVEVGDTLYFLGGSQLYKYDGIDVYQTPLPITPAVDLVHCDGNLYFTVSSILYKYEISTGTMSQVLSNVVFDVQACGDFLYFKSNFSGNFQAMELYKYDGVTYTLIDAGWPTYSRPEAYVHYGDTLYFAGDGTGGVWSYDGTTLTSIAPSSTFGNNGVENLVFVEDRLYISTTSNRYLYMYENSNTTLIETIGNPLGWFSWTAYAHNDELLYMSRDGNGDEWLKTHDGTTATLVDFGVGSTQGKGYGFVEVDDTLFLGGNNGLHPVISWYRYGSAQADLIVDCLGDPLRVGNVGSGINTAMEIYDEVLYSAEPYGATQYGYELYSFKKDSIHLMEDINSGISDAHPTNFTLFQGKIVFSAINDSYGRELWEYCPIRGSKITELACDTYTSPSGNYTWTTTGTYLDTLSTTLGCDSIITIDLHILNEKSGSITRNVCYGESINVNGTNYSVNTTNALETFSSVGPLNCDSSVYVNLAITPEINDLATREWSELEKIVALDRTERGLFGTAIDISGDFAIVGASEEGYDAFGGNHVDSAGAVYFYEKDFSGDWNVVQKVIASDRSIEDRFGYSVAISGNYAIVGARYEDENSNGGNNMTASGSAYIFHRNGAGVWSEIQKITSSDRNIGDYFGESVSITDNYAIIGAPNKNINGDLGVGVAYIFKRNYITEVWEEQVRLEDLDATDFDDFGSSVGIYDGYAVVGASREDHDAAGGNQLTSAGSAFVYEIDANGDWIEVKKIVPSDRAAMDLFGSSVSISGNAIIVGAPIKEYNSQINVGAAYIFERNGLGNWLEVEKLFPSDYSTNNAGWFGASVDITACMSVVGAYKNNYDENGGNLVTDAGAAFIYERRSTGDWVEADKIVASDRDGIDYYGWAVAISAGDIFVGALDDHDLNNSNYLFNSGAIYIQSSIQPTCLPSSSTHVIDTCYSYTTPSGNNTWSVSGTYTETGVNYEGCDSIMTFQVTIYTTPTYSTYVVSACESYTTPSGNNTWTSTATYYEVIVNSVGCDSIMEFQLTIYPAPTVTISGISSPYTVVDPDVNMTGSPAGGTFSGTGVSGLVFSPSSAGVGAHTIYYTYTDGNGCTGFDSTNVQVDPDGCISYAINSADSKIDNVELAGETVTINVSSSPTTCETYTDNTSVAPADLIIGDSYTLYVEIGSCGAENWRRGQAWIDFNQNGIYDSNETLTPFGFGWDVSGFIVQIAFTVPVTAVLGDAPMRIILTEDASSPTNPCLIYPNGETEDYTVSIISCSIDESVSLTGATLAANQSGATYQWLDCDNGNAEIVGATSQSYTTTSNGNYAVEVKTSPTCTDTSTCTLVNSVGWSDLYFQGVMVYPNPTNNLVTVEFPELIKGKITIYDAIGQIVLQENISKLKHDISLLKKERGAYFIEIESNDYSKTIRIIKQ